jgi:hypothetical protein
MRCLPINAVVQTERLQTCSNGSMPLRTKYVHRHRVSLVLACAYSVHYKKAAYLASANACGGARLLVDLV